MFMLSRQVNETVNVVLVIERLGKVRNQKHNLTIREDMEMHKNIHLLLLSQL